MRYQADVRDIVYRYDGSFAGFLCCVFESYTKKEIPSEIVTPETEQPILFEMRDIPTEKEKARRVAVGLKRLGVSVEDRVRVGFLSCAEEKDLVLLRFIRLCFAQGGQAAQMLGDIEEQSGNEVDWRSLYEQALNHDYTERFIGDIKTPVKYATPELREMLAKVDDSLTDNFIETEIPPEFRQAYRRRFSEGKDDSLEGRILSVADKIDLMYESFGEIQKGNPEPVYMDIYRSSLESIMEFHEMASVKYFLKKILPELLKDNAGTQSQTQLAVSTTQIIQR